MHFTIKLLLKRCFALLLLFIKITEALHYNDFGLSNNIKPCILTFNQIVYIFDQESLSLKFNQPWSNTIAPQISRLNINITTSAAVDACSITHSGKVILLQQQQPLQVIDDINIPWKLNNNITYLGSQSAIDTFITKSVPIPTQFAITTFNDYIIFHNGNQTFSLDTRYDTLWTFFEVPHLPNKSPQNHISLLYSTSRWVLSFRDEPQIISIDCFDPYSFQWLGTILNLNTTFYASYTIQAVVPVVSSATIASDSLLIIVAGAQSGTNNHAETSTEFWKLDISTSVPNNFTLTKLNPIIHQSDVVVFTTDLDDGHSGSVVVTPLDDEMTLFYGGAKQLQFLNTSSLTFLPQPQWLTSTNNTVDETKKDNSQPTPDHRLAIILGSVLGGLFFICVVLILFWCCRRRKNQNKILLRPNNNNNNIKEKKLPSPSERKKLLLLDKKPKRAVTEGPFQESPSISQFTLSPIVPLSPINLFPLPSDDLATSNSVTAATTTEDEGITIQQQPRLIKSRFQELFDYSFSSAINTHRIAASQSLPLESASAIITTTNNEEPPNIPRSVSSYV
ncbi:unnamed protein product [Mucor hiemalis]